MAPTATTTLNLSDLVEKLADSQGITKVAAKAFATALFEEISTAVMKGGKVSVYRFGIFTRKETRPRIGVNPQKPGEKIKIAASMRVGFKPSANNKKKKAGRK
jgi:DNA-binding protein HU-beta